jgi:hypothetical protein
MIAPPWRCRSNAVTRIPDSAITMQGEEEPARHRAHRCRRTAAMSALSQSASARRSGWQLVADPSRIDPGGARLLESQAADSEAVSGL